ncbi:MAG: tRNA (adenosine(37)-N6)-dimethylallyltransferase MiaA [Roseburia sp.]|nr:tRNA (adenosine(37)-N6)-dimethylallyltransferase MiaA [Roseburia sp.]
MVQAHRIKTVAIVGCTAVGKSAIALRLAREFNGVIIGSDSMQIYRGFDIGTGKLTKSELGGVRHELIDVADGDTPFSVGDYVELASKAIADAHSQGKLPIITGGTGMYVYSLFSGCNFANTPKNDVIRTALKLCAHIFGADVIFSFLRAVDGESAQKIAKNDVKRVVRALEIFAIKGEPKSAAADIKKPYDDMTIVLTLPRDMLYGRINARVRKMFDDGLIEEAKSLAEYADKQSMQALGYKQIISYPEMPRDELVELVAQKTRNYAKRQITYFKNVKLNKVFIDARDEDEIFKCVKNFIGWQ